VQFFVSLLLLVVVGEANVNNWAGEARWAISLDVERRLVEFWDV
jgi:hypothetical protein